MKFSSFKISLGVFLQNYWFSGTPKIKCGCQLQHVSLAAAAPPLKQLSGVWLKSWSGSKLFPSLASLTEYSANIKRSCQKNTLSTSSWFSFPSFCFLPASHSQAHPVDGEIFSATSWWFSNPSQEVIRGTCQNHLFSPLTVWSLLCITASYQILMDGIDTWSNQGALLLLLKSMLMAKQRWLFEHRQNPCNHLKQFVIISHHWFKPMILITSN